MGFVVALNEDGGDGDYDMIKGKKLAVCYGGD